VKGVWIAGLLFAAALPLAAQMTVNVRVIEVPVTVTDREGNPVRGLTAANFQVFDDGKPQKITSFDNIDFASTQEVSAISPLNPNARRSFLLLFDVGYSDVKSIARAREAAKTFVEKSVQPRDLVAVGNIDPEKGFRLLTSFTTDRNLIASAILQPERYRGNDPLQLSDVDSFGEVGSGSSPATDAGNSSDRGGNAAAADEHLKEIKEMTLRNNRDYAAGRVMKQIQSLSLLASTLRSVPGRKQVVLLSGGFDPSLVRGRSVRGALGSELADMQKATSGQAFLIDNDARFGNTASQNVLEEMTKVFKQADVVMNAIDIGGVRVDSQAGSTGTAPNDGLHLIADPTGGKVFENSNALGQNLDRMMRQQEVVYVLAFQAAAEKAGKLHNLSVKLVNGPAGATVNNRIAYYEGGGETPVQRRLTNAEVVVNDIAQSDIKVAALAAAVPPAAKRAAVPLFLEINGEDLLRGAAKPVPADIFVYAFDESGVVRDRIYQRINVDPGKASDKVKQSGIKYFATLSLPPGKYAVKSLVALPDSERRGFVRTELVVPAGTEMAILPPLFLDKPGQWAMLKGVQHDSAAYPFHLDGEPFVPSAAPRLRKAEEGEFALFLYNANPEEMMMQATVTDAAGVTRPAATSLVRQIRGEGVTKLVFHYEPSGVAPGPARLDLLIHKKGSPDVRKSTLSLLVTN
jgi:VWFA-related protein